MHAFDGQTDRNLIARPRLHSMQRGKNVTKCILDPGSLIAGHTLHRYQSRTETDGVLYKDFVYTPTRDVRPITIESLNKVADLTFLLGRRIATRW